MMSNLRREGGGRVHQGRGAKWNILSRKQYQRQGTQKGWMARDELTSFVKSQELTKSWKLKLHFMTINVKYHVIILVIFIW